MMTGVLSDDERARVAAPPDRAWTLPPRAYTDAAIWDAEVNAIFRRDWVCVAHIDQLRDPGDFLSVELLDQPLVITHAPDGEIRAMSNICLHRAMPIVSGAGNGKWMVCPYHLWSYGLDGGLHTAPMMDGVVDFDVHECTLPVIACEVWEGFVFVSLSRNPEPLAPQIEPLRKILANHRIGDLAIAHTLEFDSPWNWKILVENFMEAYHHIGPHRETFQVNYPAADSSVPDNDGGPWSCLRMPGLHDLDTSDGLPFLSGLDREQRADLLACAVFPTLLIGASSSLVAWYQLIPKAQDQMTLLIHVLLERDVLATSEIQEMLPLVAAGVDHIHNEDISVNIGPWRGLNAPLTTQGRLSTYEKAIWQLNGYWLDRLDR